MKTYMCDICGTFVNDPLKRVYMKEIVLHLKPTKRIRVHLCDSCISQIIMRSIGKAGDGK